jgi:LSD1 subclass zinc finger protein
LKIGHDYFHFFPTSLKITIPFTVYEVTYTIEESSSNAMRTPLSSERGVAELRCAWCPDSATAVHARS